MTPKESDINQGSNNIKGGDKTKEGDGIEKDAGTNGSIGTYRSYTLKELKALLNSTLMSIQ